MWRTWLVSGSGPTGVMWRGVRISSPAITCGPPGLPQVKRIECLPSVPLTNVMSGTSMGASASGSAPTGPSGWGATRTSARGAQT